MKQRSESSSPTWFAGIGLVVLSAVGIGCSEPPKPEVVDEKVESVESATPEQPVEAAEVAVEAPVAPPSKPAPVTKPVRTEPAPKPAPATESTPDREETVPPRAAAPEPNPEPEPDPLPEIVEIEVPVGTILELELLTALDSSVNRAGDEIQARTLSPLYVTGEMVLPAGAYVEGRITEVEAAGRVKGRARLAFTFDRLRTPTRLEKIRTSYVEQQSESGKKKDAAVIGGAAGVGAVVGGIIGGKKGAAIGGAIGGAGGTGVVLTTKGEEIRLPAGTAVNVRLDESFVVQKN